SIRAVELAAAAGQWLRCRTRDGQQAFGIPSHCQHSRFYLVTSSTCDCEDAQRHGMAGLCKHVLAVRLHLALLKGSVARTRPQSRFQRHDKPSGETMWLPRRDTGDVTNESDERFWRRFED